MAKQTGLGDNYYVDGYDLSGDTNSLGSVRGGFTPIDVTDITQSAYERKGGKKDGELSWIAYFNPTNAHLALSPLPTSARYVTYCRGTALGSAAASAVVKQIDYNPTRGEDGSITMAVQALTTGGIPLEWGTLHTPGKRTDTEDTDGASVDAGAASAYGLQAFLHIFSTDGTITVGIESSSDNGVGDGWEDVVDFEEAEVGETAAFSQRIVKTGAIERYLRIVTTGDFTSATFAVNIVRNATTREYS
jgi:hypothetical protein